MGTRHVVLSLLVVLSILTFLDRLCIAVAGPRMQSELGISPQQWGWVLGAFVLAYGLFEIPTGMMGDRSGQRSVLTRIVLWWSGFTALTGAMSGFVPLVAVRFLFGAGEAGAYPNMAGVVARWFPPRERARAQGYVWGASRAGGALAPLMVVPLQQAFGWRASFWIFGFLGVIWCAVWWWWYRDDPRERGEQVHYVASVHRLDWSLLASSTQLWTILLMYGSYAWGSWFYFSWLHTYLVKARGFTEGEMALASSFPFVLGTISNIGGGYLSDYACRRLGMKLGRKLVGTLCLTAAAGVLIAAAMTADKLTAALLLAVSFGTMDLMLPSAWAICLDIGGNHAGAVTGAMNTAGQLGGFVCTVVFGYVVAYFQDYNAPLFLIAGMLLFAALLFSRIDATKPLFPGKES
ncbi:MAG: MFS transporter [Bryobacteraceae bacterium]|nr:MFS transporter [Bryobacteraceae bacterium]